MIKQNILIGLDHIDDVEAYMRDACDGVEQGSYMRVLTADELSLKREELSTKFIEHAKIDEEFSNVKEQYKDQLVPMAKELKLIASVINAGQEECRGTTYKFIDRESGYVGFYDERGNLVSSRRMLPEESQSHILDMRKVVNL